MPPTELTLSPAEQQQWDQDGYFLRTGQFTDTELAAFRSAAERAAGQACARTHEGREYQLDGKRFVDVGPATLQFEHEPGSTTLRVLEPVHLFDPVLDALIDDPRLAQPMRELVGDESVALWTSKLNVKGGYGSAFPWHQDSPYWMHDCDHVDQLPNVMLALDSQSEKNGCFRVIRGSHRGGMLPGTQDGTKLGGFYTSASKFSEQQQVALQVAAGTLIFFSPHSVHGSLENTSSAPRRALIFTYQPGTFPMLKNAKVRNVAS